MGMEKGPSPEQRSLLSGEGEDLESVMLELGLKGGNGAGGKGIWPKTLHPEQALE